MRVNSSPADYGQAIQTGDFPAATPGSSPTSFAAELKANIQAVDNFQHEAEQTMQQRTVKGAENIHETMIQLEEADLSLRLLVKVRNKAMESYQEIMRMQF